MTTSNFEKVLKETQDARRKSDLVNLARAMISVDDSINQYLGLKEEILKAAKAIEAGQILPEGFVQSLYNRAR